MQRCKSALVLSTLIILLSLLAAVPAWAGDVAHRVQPGENLKKIAESNNIELDKLLAANPFIEYPYEIYPGQVVVIPDTRPGQKYTVVPGDTPASIASRNGIDVKTLVNYNNLGEQTVAPGQILILPPAPKKDGPAQPAKPATKKPVYQYNIPKLLASFPENFYLSGKPDKKVVAITFDDGPDRVYTPQILNILKKENVKATFFLVGQQIENYPEVVSQLVAGGNQIAGHSWSHTNLRYKKISEVKKELKMTSGAIKSISGLEPLFIRPPYGEMSVDGMKALTNLGYIAVNWSVDSLDWHSHSVNDILTTTLKETRRGSIILMHSTGGNLDATVKALPQLIDTLKAQGYSFVTVSDLLDKEPYRQGTR